MITQMFLGERYKELMIIRQSLRGLKHIRVCLFENDRVCQKPIVLNVFLDRLFSIWYYDTFIQF